MTRTEGCKVSKRNESVTEIEIAFEKPYILTILIRFRTQFPIRKIPLLITNDNTSIFVLTLHKLHYIKFKSCFTRKKCKETNYHDIETSRTVLKRQNLIERQRDIIFNLSIEYFLKKFVETKRNETRVEK